MFSEADSPRSSAETRGKPGNGKYFSHYLPYPSKIISGVAHVAPLRENAPIIQLERVARPTCAGMTCGLNSFPSESIEYGVSIPRLSDAVTASVMTDGGSAVQREEFRLTQLDWKKNNA
ncbi:hypothetical protein EVAR_50709_1 [Eumeta japonica]|uniref:Uncharacterized protein n=1 Tax=Eumeta variegata TaxID=151549 RepID=A0A4C1YS17_EUMVA|nr:hypothetical protein EVAR_50709_1 [Eumeta japonica]